MAAKADGHDFVDGESCEEWAGWNPIEDDGDALRLAVKLRLAIDFSSNGVYVGRDPEDPDGDWVFESLKLSQLGFDEYAATRRAIVRAAAEIGKGME